jgi:predicted nucleic acid-binding protein
MSIVSASAGLLVDTSAWIEIFARPARLSIDDFTDDRDRIVTCLPIIQEVLQGFDDERPFRIANTAMYALPCLDSPLTDRRIDEAVDLCRRARRAGLTVRSSVECLIAASAVRYHVTVVHNARDYTHLARVVALNHLDIGPLLRTRRARA